MQPSIIVKEPLMPVRTCLTTVALFLCVSGLASCSKHVKPPSTVPVKGTVTLNGKPAIGVRVTMHPQFTTSGHQWLAIGETGEGGAFIVQTGSANIGAPPGEYIVTFTKPRVTSDPKLNGIEVEVDDFEGKYSDPETSEWTVVVEKDESTLGPFELN